MIDSWTCALTATTSTGDLKQLFPSWCPTGTNPAVAVPGDQIRKPTEGFMRAAQVKTDGTNGGYVEIWDVTGFDLGLDMSSGTAITNTQLTSLITLGKAKKIWDQNFTATSGASTPSAFGKQFVHGLAARFVSGAGACTLNLDVEGGFRLNETAGA